MSAVTGYTVEYIAARGSWRDANDTGTDTTHTITGLTNGVTCSFRVRATNAAGDSAWSDTATATPTTSEPTTPEPTPALPVAGLCMLFVVLLGCGMRRRR